MVEVLGPRDNVGTTMADLAQSFDVRDLLDQIQGPGGNDDPTGIRPRIQAITGGIGGGFIPTPSNLTPELIAQLTRIGQQPGQWVIHAPQPEADQPSGVRYDNATKPGRWFTYENVNTGEQVFLPRDAAAKEAGQGDQGPVNTPPSQPDNQAGIPNTPSNVSNQLAQQIHSNVVRTPDVSGSNTYSGQTSGTSKVSQSGSSASKPAISGQVVRLNG